MTSSYLLFLLSGRLFGLKLAGALEILPWRAFRTVPMSYPYVQGLIDYRGTIYPVFDLANRLQLARSGPIGFTGEQAGAAKNEQSIILLEENKKPFGIVVDAVVKMNRMVEQPAPPEKVQGVDHKYVKGFVYDEDREIMILDFERLFHAN